MKYKVLAFDIDGTLTNSDKKITPATRNSILMAAKQGCTIALASGRPMQGLTDYAEELCLADNGGYILALNGGLIERCSDGMVIRKTVVPEKYYSEIYQIAIENNVNLMTYEGDNIIAENIDDKYLDIESRIIGLGKKRVDNLKDYLTFKVPKFIMLGDGDYLEKIEDSVRTALSGKVDVYRSEPFFLEILPKNVNKATALEKLLNHLGVSREELMVFGDGYNDITMVKYAGIGVAMGNANDKLKAEADYIAPSNDEDGIAEVINKFVLD